MTDPVPILVKTVVLPTIGEVITCLTTGNTYTMGEKIGEGAFCSAYECTDGWDNELAAKVLKATSSYETVKARALAEVQRLVALRHPNITYIFDAFEYRDTFFIITERCHLSGHDLFQIPSFDGEVWIEPIARSILQAVYYLHINHCTHQDIHPGNIFAQFPRNEMLNQPMEGLHFKLADLGVAQLAGQTAVDNLRAQWMLPPEVLAPEKFGPADHRVDIYHLGLLFLQLALSKELRFTQDEVLAGKPRELALTLPMPFSVAIEKALRRRVQFRTASAMELWRDLQTSVG